MRALCEGRIYSGPEFGYQICGTWPAKRVDTSPIRYLCSSCEVQYKAVEASEKLKKEEGKVEVKTSACEVWGPSSYYAESEIFSPSEVSLLRVAEKYVERIPGKIDGEWVRCHELARAVGRYLRQPVVDGKYLMIEHSWISLPNRHILDVYVPGRIPQVQLIDISLPTFVSDYVPEEPRTDIDEELVERIRRRMKL